MGSLRTRPSRGRRRSGSLPPSGRGCLYEAAQTVAAASEDVRHAAASDDPEGNLSRLGDTLAGSNKRPTNPRWTWHVRVGCWRPPAIGPAVAVVGGRQATTAG